MLNCTVEPTVDTVALGKVGRRSIEMLVQVWICPRAAIASRTGRAHGLSDAHLTELGPMLASWPYFLEMALITAVVAFLMAYIVIRRLSA
jgi:hypothetical protein